MKKHSVWTITRTYLLSSVCAILLLCSSGCGIVVGPFPSGGVRTFTQEQLFDMNDVTLPIAGAEIHGVVLQVFGVQYGDLSILGFTDGNGIDDQPLAQGNAQWQLLAEFAFSSAPGCPDDGPKTLAGGPGGLEWDITCIIK